MKLTEENIGRTLFDINCSNIFLDLSPKAKEIKAKINKWDLTKLKSLKYPTSINSSYQLNIKNKQTNKPS